MRRSNTSTPPRPRRCPASSAVAHHQEGGGGSFFAGDEILALAADTEEHADDACARCTVEYAVLPHHCRRKTTPCSTTNTARRPRHEPTSSAAGFRHRTTSRTAFNGAAADASKGVTACAVISHQCLESHGLVAEWDDEQEDLTVWASTQAVAGTADAWPDTSRAQFKLKPGTRSSASRTTWAAASAASSAPISRACRRRAGAKAKAAVKLMLDRAEEITVGGIRPSAYRQGQDRRHQGRHAHRL